MLQVQSECTDLTREDRFKGEAMNLARDAVVVIRGQTELMPVLETLRYAVAERIDVDEASCLEASKSCETLIQEAFGYAFVGVDAAVAEEGPVLAGYFDEFGVQVGDEDFFLVR